MAQAWMVRAGKNGYMSQQCWDKGCIAYGWAIPDLSGVKDREDIDRAIRKVYPDWSANQIRSCVGQYYRFIIAMQIDDLVITYDGDQRIYFVGRIIGPCEFDTDRVGGLEHVRSVRWERKVARDALSPATRTMLVSSLSVFKINPVAANEILSLPVELSQPSNSNGPIKAVTEDAVGDEVESVDNLRQDLQSRAFEFIKDRIIRLDWTEMQDLVAGILRAMGYKTKVSKAGSDLGRDVIASPDGLGLSPPRVFVEVKHRPRTQIDAPTIRSFLGGRRPGDFGMYVSTGGFSKEARYEGERSAIPLVLIGIDDLVELLVQHYPQLDADTRALIPLIPIYWPA